MIVATAGHVDHGKTTLIKALTGTDTTHLPEERKRGMTIDLGFAALALPGGGFIGFVDVPGHERFVRNMLAGITGVDLALLIVAADDGIMPQTREHLELLDLLEVTEATVALTKIDRVDSARLADVAASITASACANASLGCADLCSVGSRRHRNCCATEPPDFAGTAREQVSAWRTLPPPDRSKFRSGRSRSGRDRHDCFGQGRCR